MDPRIASFQTGFQAILDNCRRVIQGKDEVVRQVLLALTARGHILLEDVPGTGKTMLARALAASIGGDFRRIQFTPDLLPMDITGSNVFNLRSKAFEFQRGPVFANILLADEINRATPKTQSALLEVMAERQVTVEGQTFPLPPPFLVLATMNPLDHDGTYPLPAAQLDRFAVQLSLGFPAPQAEMTMLDVHLGARSPIDDLAPVVTREAFVSWQETVPMVYVSDAAKQYVVDLVNLIRSDARALTPPSPRATLVMVRTAQAHALAGGRTFVSPDDVQAVAADVLRHRTRLAGDVGVHAYVREVVGRLPVPA